MEPIQKNNSGKIWRSARPQCILERSRCGHIGIQGPKVLVNGQTPADKFYGVVDGSFLEFTILAYLEGQSDMLVKAQCLMGLIRGNTDLSRPTIPPPISSTDTLLCWILYCCLVRVGAFDIWGTGVLYNAWSDHHEA